MFDNHRTPSIPPRAAPPAKRPTQLARNCTLAALVGLPLMLAAFIGSISLWTVLLLGLTQTALVSVAAVMVSRPARAIPSTSRQRFDHG